MLKLCLALPTFFPTFGGGPLRILRAQSGLRKRDVHARVLAGTARSKDDSHADAAGRAKDVEETDDAIARDWPIGSMLPIEHVDGIPVHRVSLPSVTGIERTSTYFRALLALCEDPATRPDVIQLHSFERVESLYWLSRLRRLQIPVVHAIQIARPIRRRAAPGRFLEQRFRRAFYERFDSILTNSDAIRSSLRGWSVTTPISVVPNGVDFARFGTDARDRDGSRARARLGIDGDGPILLGVGAICPRKGSDLLVDAWTKLLDRHPEARLLLVGPRHDRNNPNLAAFGERLRLAIANSPRPDQVHLMGVRDDMNDVYAAADAVVLASSREGMPNTVVEAMACHRPVVLTPFLGQSKHLGRAGREYLQCERSADALAGGLARVLGDRTLRERLVASGREWVERHLDLDSNLDTLADFYRSTSADSNAFEAKRSGPRRTRRDEPRCDVLIVTDRRFWRRSIGSEQRIANLLLYLEGRGVAVAAAHVGRVGPSERGERAALERFRREAPGLRILTRPMGVKSLRPGGARSARRDFVRSVARRYAPSIVIVEFLRLTDLVFPRPDVDTKASWWIDTHDVMHQRTDRFRRAGLPLEKGMGEAEETRLLDTYDAILAIQPIEATRFRELLPQKEVIVVPHGLPLPIVGSPSDSTQKRTGQRDRPTRIGFLGGPGEANRHALDWFGTHVWPELRRRFGKKVELHVAGGICGEWRFDLDGLVVVGRVDTIDAFWSRIDIAINPARVGSGLKIKNVEALAWGLPLLTTRTGAEGLEDASRDGLQVAEDPDDWTRILAEWSSDPCAAAEIGRHGRVHAERALSMDRAFSDLEQRIAQTLGDLGR